MKQYPRIMLAAIPASALLLSAGCSSSEPDTPLVDAREAQESAAEMVDQTEKSVAEIGATLEAVGQQVTELKKERDELQSRLAKQDERINALEQQLAAEARAKSEAQDRLAKQTEEANKLKSQLAKEKRAREEAEQKLAGTSGEEAPPEADAKTDVDPDTQEDK